MTKKQINNRGYNKFLKLTPHPGNINVEIDQSKVEQSARWDGLKGYLTNTTLPADAILAHDGQLWHIEKAFRISKTDLRIRPMFHILAHDGQLWHIEKAFRISKTDLRIRPMFHYRRRIEAHVLIAFVAYTI